MSAPIVAVRITNSATYSRSRNYRSAGHHRLAQLTLSVKVCKTRRSRAKTCFRFYQLAAVCDIYFGILLLFSQTFKKLSSDDALAVMSSAETTTPTGSSETLRGSSSNGCTTETTTTTTPASSSQPKSRDTTREASWPWVLFYIHLNILGVYGIFVLFSHTSAITLVFTAFLTLCGILGATAGAHRLWAHKTYHASTLLRFILMLCQTMAGQGSIYEWVRLHRLHHDKFRTADDPYYSDKDFLHGQVFANIRKLSPRQERLLAEVDMRDLESDRIVMFQKRFYWLLYPVLFVLLPINAPLEYWGDTVQAAIFVAFSLRYLLVLNVAWMINSAHFVWGLDKNHKQSDSNMVFLVTKSYWPQYHYLLPFDYQSGEFGSYGSGCTTAFIRICAAMGLATKLQTMTTDAVKRGLTMAVDSGRPIVDCLKQAGAEDMCNLQREHYLKNERLH